MTPHVSPTCGRRKKRRMSITRWLLKLCVSEKNGCSTVASARGKTILRRSGFCSIMSSLKNRASPPVPDPPALARFSAACRYRLSSTFDSI